MTFVVDINVAGLFVDHFELLLVVDSRNGPSPVFDGLTFDLLAFQFVESLEVRATFVIGVMAFEQACEDHLSCCLVFVTCGVVTQVYITLTVILEESVWVGRGFPEVSLPLTGETAI